MRSLLSPNATALERALEILAATRLDGIGVPLREEWSAQNCPEDHLPWLAWGLSIDQWSADWPLHIRRARVASAIDIQRRKGTPKSVIDVVNSFGGSVKVREWFEMDPPGDPHTFSLSVSLSGQGSQAPTPEFIDSVISEVSRTKPVRSHFDFTVAVATSAAIGLRAVARPITYARIWSQAPGA